MLFSLPFISSSSAGYYNKINQLKYLDVLDTFLIRLKVVHDEFFVVVELVDEIGKAAGFFHFADDCLGDGVEGVQVA